MTSTTLYKKDTKGKTRVWTIEQKDDKYRTIAGEHGGKLVTSEWTVAKPMNVGKANATTGEQQAKLEVASEIKKKKEKNYVTNVGNIDEQTYQSPMLAKSFDDYGADLVYPVYSQPKLDGIRCTVGPDSMLSRNGKAIVSCPHILESLAEVHAKLKKHSPKLGNFRFDGELYSHKFKHNFNRICELVKRMKPTEEDLKASADLVEFWCYDIFTDGDLPFSARALRVCTFLDDIPGIVVVKTVLCGDREALNEKYESYMNDGYEGQIIRVSDSKYQFKRTKDLLKRKEFQDREWLIDEVFEGEGNRSGMAGYVTLLNDDGTKFIAKNGEQVKSNIKGSHEWLKKLWLEREQVHGKKGTIKYFNMTPDEVPRFPYLIGIRDYE